jgi:predicted nucleotidyltransferase
MNDLELLDRLQAAAARVFPRVPVLAAYAFGSRVSGRPGPRSDLDVGYFLDAGETGSPLGPHEETTLAAELEDGVGVPVDLRDLSEASLELRGRVLEEGVRIYTGNPARRVALERSVLARYHDYKHEYQAMHETRLRRVATRGL